MSNHSHTSVELTKNQSLVKNVLNEAKAPMSAYTILHELRNDGIRAPLQVYRALDKLVEFGLVHRLESLNAFVACQHPSCENEATIMFAICDECEEVQELVNSSLVSEFNKLAENIDFSLRESVIELRGVCANCR